jgi:hypothetical protein
MPRYRDFVSYVAFGLSIPFVLVKAVVTALPTLVTVVLAKFGLNRSSEAAFTVVKTAADGLNAVEKYWIYGVSALLYPKSYSQYLENCSVVNFLNHHVTNSDHPKARGMPANVRNAIAKEGFWEVTWKMVAMFSFLPTYRHAFLNNPLLFRYQLYLTNQATEAFVDRRKMCQIMFGYINDPTFLLRSDGTSELSLDQIGFTPNYSNDGSDFVIDYDNYGMQLGGQYATLIYLETLHKSPEELQKALDEGQTSSSIINADHPIHRLIGQEGLEMVKFRDFDSRRRCGVLDLVVPYDDYYHVVTGKVEANIVDGSVIEHPMLCLYHDGHLMTYTWSLIEALFSDRVMRYLTLVERDYQPYEKAKK